ncbi:hypothetical protein PV327_010944 [Microctonus hyperodae]|uniref:Uncharacterized protein n=1 Tax=Microctonus hyperodae TaxID=165561 RepID=A0AA39KUM3_MICHY|nr:hypothetical protein PV327_010944 [Microctonus hyperodae]
MAPRSQPVWAPNIMQASLTNFYTGDSFEFLPHELIRSQTFRPPSATACTTMNWPCAEKINDVITRFNGRRAAGILAQPRVGRTEDMLNFAKLDGVAGLVHYPRVHSSDFSTSVTSIQDDIPIEHEKMVKFSNACKVYMTSLVNFKIQKHPYNDNTPGHQQFEISKKNGRTRDFTQSCHGATMRDQHHLRFNQFINRAKNGAQSLLFAPSKGFVESGRQLVRNHVPRLAREIDHAQQNILP